MADDSSAAQKVVDVNESSDHRRFPLSSSPANDTIVSSISTESKTPHPPPPASSHLTEPEASEMTPLRYQQLDDSGHARRPSDDDDAVTIRSEQGGMFHRDHHHQSGNRGCIASFLWFWSRTCLFMRNWAQSCWHHVRAEMIQLKYFCTFAFYKVTCQRQEAERLASSKGDAQPNRVILLNPPVTHPGGVPNGVREYPTNHVTTAKYSILSFIPLFLFEQFSRYANLFFLLISILQVTLPEYSPTGQFTTAGPLCIILFVSALKELYEDVRRDKADSKVNSSSTVVLRDNAWHRARWHELRVGNIIRVEIDQIVPADLILLSSAAQHGIAYIETAQLDGETNLKMRKALSQTANVRSRIEAIVALHGRVECAPPNRHLYDFRGNVSITAPEPSQIPLSLGAEQLLLRGASLRNTRWIVGLVAYTGHDTKLMLNSAATPLKQSGLEKRTNFQIIFLFSLLLILAGICAVANMVVRKSQITDHWYLTDVMKWRPASVGGNTSSSSTASELPLTFLTFLILYNNLVPISLLVTLEVVKFVQAIFISSDLEMYDPTSDTPALARTSNLNEELGQVSYVFSDKTGTLTRNVMVFRSCSIGGELYGDVLQDEEERRRLSKDAAKRPDGPLDRFLTAIALCHTVVPERKQPKITYMASSPDEAALVSASQAAGYEFVDRTPDSLLVAIGDEHRRYDLLQVLEFTSARRRMSIIVKDRRNNRISLLIKGADVAILDRLRFPEGSSQSSPPPEVAQMQKHLDEFAARGHRTLCIAECQLTEADYNAWAVDYVQALALLGPDRADKVAEVCDRIERDLTLLGVTAIEDRLQDGVPETIASLLACNIRVWVLTGDRAETAINVAHACRLFLPAPSPLLTLTAPMESSLSEGEQRDRILLELRQIEDDPQSSMSFSLVIDGLSLRYVLADESARQRFLRLATRARSVMCCRVSPMQKAEVVTLVRSYIKPEPTTLAIGDGANDVSMIRAANIGIGISGVEGLQAVCAADYAIAQFRFLRRLLFVHGTICYRRLSTLVLYCFYKNVCLYAINMWFAYFCGWSGTALFDRWLIATYNVIFTSLPPGVIGVLDWPTTPQALLKHPKRYYADGQANRLFNSGVFWTWMADAILHSGLIFFITAIGTGGSPLSFSQGGLMADHITAGNFAFTAVLLTVSVRAGLTLHHWTWLSAVGIFFGVVVWFVIVVPAYSYFYPTLNFPAMSGQVEILYESPTFWLSACIAAPLAALAFDALLLIGDRLLEHPSSWPTIWRTNEVQQPCAACAPLFNRLWRRWRGRGSSQQQQNIQTIQTSFDEVATIRPSQLHSSNAAPKVREAAAQMSQACDSLSSPATSPDRPLPGLPPQHRDSLSEATRRGYAFSQDETPTSNVLRIWDGEELGLPEGGHYPTTPGSDHTK